MTTEDVVLQVGERAVLEPLGAGITAVTLPALISQSETADFTFTITFSSSRTLL